MRAAVEPREAQRPTSLAARTPQAAILGNGDIAVGAIKRTLARSAGEPRKLSGASRRSIPSLRGEGKQGCGRARRPRNKNTGGGALADLLHGCLKTESVLRCARNIILPPLGGKVARAEVIAERESGGDCAQHKPTPPGRSLTLASTLPEN